MRFIRYNEVYANSYSTVNWKHGEENVGYTLQLLMHNSEITFQFTNNIGGEMIKLVNEMQ